MMRNILLLWLLAGLAGCAVGPDYHRPAVETPAAYKEFQSWKPAQPQDQISRGNWWQIYGDATLNGLMQQVAVSNQSVMAAAAQYRQALALLDAAISGFSPTVFGAASSTRSYSGSSNPAIKTSDSLSLNSSWAMDVWGGIRRTVEANRANAEASAADLGAVTLSMQALLAQSYLQLRVADAQYSLLQQTVTAYQSSLQITRNLYEAGVVSNLDIELANTQLKSTQAQMIDIGVLRAQLEHAIALLVGKAPADFSLAANNILPVLPATPVSVPSALLERRPDIAAAERRIAAANAQIGVAQAAFYPSVILNASGGYQGNNFANLLAVPNRFWALGPSLIGTLFDGGLLNAQKAQAIAAYDNSVANYRLIVLTGFQEVENNLAALRILKQEIDVEQEAAKSAKNVLQITNNQYQAGTVSYLNVVLAQVTSLAAESTRLNLVGRDLSASVGLLTALGGNW